MSVEQIAKGKSWLTVARDWTENVPSYKKVLETIGGIIHLNRLSASRALLAPLIPVVDQISHAVSSISYARTILLTDIGGGAVTRATGKKSRVGALLNPLADKIANVQILLYQMAMHVDHLLSQRQRGLFCVRCERDTQASFVQTSVLPVPTTTIRPIGRGRASRDWRLRHSRKCLHPGTTKLCRSRQQLRSRPQRCWMRWGPRSVS